MQKSVDTPCHTQNNLSNLSDLSENSKVNTEQKEKTREEMVLRGLRFILKHFPEPWFPRYISRPGSVRKWRYLADSEDTAMMHFRAALWEDLRISAFAIDQKNPNLIFIDLDLERFGGNMRRLNRALAETVKKIYFKLDGAKPTVIWSGHGYHVILPIDCSRPLEEIEKGLAALKPGEGGGELSKAFMQFAERYLTSGKCDPSSHPSPSSCWLRIPNSVNTKDAQKREDVRIVQEWNGKRPSYDLLLGVFHAYLLEKSTSLASSSLPSSNNSSSHHHPHEIYWIEKLLQTAIPDGRKLVLDLILSSYLTVVKKQDGPTAYKTIMAWLEKCDKVKRLNFNARKRTTEKIQRAISERVPPMGLSKLRDRHPELYDKVVIVIKS